MMPPQTDKLSILRAVLAQVAGSGGDGMPSGFGGMQGMRGDRPLANLQPPMTTAPVNVYGYPEGLSPEVRGVMNVTQPFSRGMQGQMNMVDNMNTAYNVRDQLGDALRNNMAVTQVRQSNPDVTTPDAVVRSKDTPSKVSPTQSSSKPSPKTPTQSFGKPTPLGVSSSPQQNKMSVPISKVEPSGDALSYFRKNKQSGGWDALGTGVSLVQQSMKPEKGGLKSRAEYDRLLRGSDNFKKLDGNEQQRVRQAFAQWMNEQTVFKGKA